MWDSAQNVTELYMPPPASRRGVICIMAWMTAPAIQDDPRRRQLEAWLRDDLGLAFTGIAPASADASFRRYFRLRLPDGSSRIVMDAPPAHEDTGPFRRIAALLAGMGLHVPQVLAADTGRGFLLLSDLGERTYLPALNDATADALYGDALDALRILQAHGPADLPPYDHALLMQEMALFRDWFLGTHLRLTLDDGEQALLERTFAALAGSALEQPVVIVHRDYHARNLMVSDPNPSILDFQDAVMGPVTYDLVSLLRDCYIAWPRERVEAWVREHHARLRAEGLLDGVDAATFLHWFERMGIQRHLKAIGIFARLNHRDGKPGYLGDIPRTLGYVREAAPRHSDLADFAAFIESRVVSALQAHT